MDVFKHRPLSAPTSYRLVRLGGTLNVDYFTVELSEHEAGYLPCYSALSYRWGSDSASQTILLNGKRFQVRQNLWHFLRQLHLERDYTYYWIDALCIDQEDLLERGRYVLQVGELYSHAQRVLVWLGHYEFLEHCLREMAESHKPDYLLGEDDATRSIARSNLCSMVLKLQYWSRAWIVQEILLGRTVVVKCLSQHLSIEFLYHYCLRHMIPQPDIWRLERAWTLLENIKRIRDPNLLDWLFFIADQECVDPRDKAYSFLGLHRRRLGSSNPISTMIIDYRKSTTTVYWDCVYSLIPFRKGLSDQSIKQFALRLRQWLEKVLCLTPIENVRAIDSSHLSLLTSYLADTTVSERYKSLADVTMIVAIAFGLSWSVAPTCLPFRAFVFACTKTHIDTDIRGAAMLVPPDHGADGSPIYDHLTSLARTQSTAEWQCTSCFRIVGDFFISDNQLRNEDSDRVTLMRTSDKGKRKVIQHAPFTVLPWHKNIASCADCSSIEHAVVRQLRAACAKRDWDKIGRHDSNVDISLLNEIDEINGNPRTAKARGAEP